VLLFDTVRRQLEGTETAAVPYVVGLQQAQAENEIEEEGLVARVRRVSNSDVEEGDVFKQSPKAGERVEPGSVVLIDVSSGKPEVEIPNVVGKTRDSAVAELARVGLDARVVEVNSDREEGTVTAQSPEAGLVVVEGTQVRINVSKGPKPVVVPTVVGLPYDRAASELQQAGFGVTRVDVASNLERNTVVDQDPDGGSQSSKGTTVTLSVSRGPDTVTVPDVTTFDVTIARTTLENAGFQVREQLEDTDDPNSESIVIGQDPAGQTQAKPGSVVTIFVGNFTGGETTTETQPTETTPTEP
jgi:serine/threonine-protein kinase